MTTQSTIIYREMHPNDFAAVIKLATTVHGEGYLDNSNINAWYLKGVSQQINGNFVAYDKNTLVGFRITFAANQWDIDRWSSPKKWQIAPEQVCYFKCNTVAENSRGFGVGSQLLALAIAAAKRQGATAGISHLWKQSPGNSAVKYFTKCGGELIAEHPDRWNELSKQGYCCTICPDECHCDAAEMIIRF